MTRQANHGAGFTLIELLVVVAIIGLLASIIGTALNVSRIRARDAKRITDLKQTKTGMDLFFSSGSGYPTQGVWNLTVGQMLRCAGIDFFVIPHDPQTPIYTYTYSNPVTATTFNGPCGVVSSQYLIKFFIENKNAYYFMDEDGNVYIDNSGIPGSPISFDSLL